METSRYGLITSVYTDNLYAAALGFSNPSCSQVHAYFIILYVYVLYYANCVLKIVK